MREEYRRTAGIALKFEYFYKVRYYMLIRNSSTIDDREHDKINSQLAYSPSLEAAVALMLADPALVDELETHSFKFIRAARFLKDNAPHVFQIREMRAEAKNSMDRWLWDLLDKEHRSSFSLQSSTPGGSQPDHRL
jgi:hypothetical protein